jgi:hypothetical protein
MRTVLVTVLVALAACKSQPAASDAPAETRGTQPTALPAPAPPPPAAPYYSVEELRALGLAASAAGDGEMLVCSAEGNGECVCLASLDCGEGGCITYEANVTAFRQVLEKAPQGVKVYCDRAEVGRCDAFRYFDFEGDLERRELRWFDETGALVGQRNVTDYEAYCGHQTRVRYQGRVPRCEKLSGSEHICGEHRRPARTPLEDLRRFTARRG